MTYEVKFISPTRPLFYLVQAQSGGGKITTPLGFASFTIHGFDVKNMAIKLYVDLQIT